MNREQEDQLLARLSELREQRIKLVARIVAARQQGRQDKRAIAKLQALSDRQIQLTNAPMEAAA